MKNTNQKIRKLYWCLVALLCISASPYVIAASRIGYAVRRVSKVVQQQQPVRKIWYVTRSKRRFTLLPYTIRQYATKRYTTKAAIMSPIQRISPYRVHENTDHRYTHREHMRIVALNFMLLCAGASAALIHSTMAKAENYGVTQANEFFRDLDEMLFNAKKHLDLAKGRDCIVVIGETGCGKTTMLNAIYNGSDTLKTGMDGDSLVTSKLIKKDGEQIFESRGGTESVTSWPETLLIDNKVLCDCPGFNDTKGDIRDLINAITIGRLLKNAGKVRLMFFLSDESISSQSGRGRSLRGLLYILHYLIKDVEYKHLQKIQMVINPMQGNKTKKDLLIKFKSTFKYISKKDTDEKKIKAILDNLLVVDPADRVSKFKNQKRSWFLYYCYSEDQTTVEELKDILFNAKPNKWFKPTDFRTPCSPKIRGVLEKMYSTIQQEALAIIKDDENADDYEDRVLHLMGTLKKFKTYNIDILNVDDYIRPIAKALDEKKRKLNQREIEANLRSGLEEARRISREKMEKEFSNKNLSWVEMLLKAISGIFF